MVAASAMRRTGDGPSRKHAKYTVMALSENPSCFKTFSTIPGRTTVEYVRFSCNNGEYSYTDLDYSSPVHCTAGHIRDTEHCIPPSFTCQLFFYTICG